MKFAVLGGGNGAKAMTADLSMSGHEVNLYELPRFKENIAAVQLLGGIKLIVKDLGGKEFTAPAGGRTGFAKITGKVTTDIKSAVEGVQIIMIVVPSFAHIEFIEELVPYLEDGQIVVFNPGNFGSLEFFRILKERKIEKNVMIAETECLIYATRLVGPVKSRIWAGKDEVLFSSLPAKDTDSVLKVIRQVYPQFVPAANVFETSLNNINFVVHPTSMIMNASNIEEMGSYKYHHYGATRSIVRVMDAVDKEKMAIAKALNVRQNSVKDILYRYYGAEGETLWEVITDCKTYKTQKAPDNLKSRFITEDVPYGLVPLASLGQLLGVATPTIKALIQIASTMNQTDYWDKGRTVERMGLREMSAEDIIKFVTG